MILTCPTCASQYSLDDGKLAAGPRKVRCAGCKTVWTAWPPAAEAPAAAQPPAAVPPESPPAAASSEPEPPEPQAGEPKLDMPLPLAFRAKAVAKKRTREAAVAGLVWGGLGAAVLALLAAAALFRVDVVRLWPRTAGAYAKVGLPVNPIGLTPENVEAGTGLVNGRAAVVVTGQLRNIHTHAQPAQPLRVALLDADGKRLAVQVAEAGPAPIPPGGTRPFRVQFVDPPSGSRDVEVEFAFDLIKPRLEKTAAHPPAHEDGHAPAPKPGPEPGHGPAEVAPEGVHIAPEAEKPHAEAHPEPHAAEPLPGDSPYALPKAAAGNNPEHGHGDG